MVSRTYSAVHRGVDGEGVEIEAARENALPALQVTGLPGPIVRESRERIRVCLAHLGFPVPSGRIVIHLLPAGAPKQGSHLDLAIALAVLGAERCLEGVELGRFGFLGELTLDGRLRPVTGALALTEALLARPRLEAVVVPAANGAEVGLLRSSRVRLAEHLGEVLDFLRGAGELPPASAAEGRAGSPCGTSLDDLWGQPLAKRALQIALAGSHSLLLVGSPGVGKTMLAQCAPALCPELPPGEWVEVVKSHARAPEQLPPWGRPPFRSPHHTISASALLGGGSGTVVPGEVTLAHRGVLFLDELAEFRREALEGLREPLQNGSIHLHRVGMAVTLPARFTLLAAMNPCPCGYSLASRCRCSPETVAAYRRRLSGPLLDRFDLCVVLGSAGEGGTPPELSHAAVAESIRRARERMAEPAPPGPEARDWIDERVRRDGASYRAAFRSLRVARTLALLEGDSEVGEKSLREAWSLRCPESFARSLGY